MKSFKHLFYIPVLCAGLMAGGCSNDTLPETDVQQEQTASVEKTGKLRFRIGGSATSRAAVGRAYQTESEKKVSRLVAVFFTGNTEKTGPVQPQGNETFREYVEIIRSTDDPLQENQEYTIELTTPATLMMCLVANPDDDLLQRISQLQASASISTFKALATEANPDDSDKLMTSDFYSIYLPKNGNASLGTVDLTRAMARVDIINLAQGITITGVDFINRAKSTVLKTDSQNSWSSDALENKVYSNLNLEGASEEGDANTCKARIYSYENLSSSDTERPELVIHYTKGGVNKKHTVQFQQYNSEGAPIPLPVKRNTLYRIMVSDKYGDGVQFYVVVADWNTGTEIKVSPDDIATGLATPGDFLMSDGRILSKNTELSDILRNNIVGIVCYLTKDLNDPKLGAGVQAQLESSTLSQHGLAIALHDATTPEGKAWKNENTTDTARPALTLLQDARLNYNGYSTSTSTYPTSDLSTNYPAFNAAYTYNNSHQPTGFVNTGWYIPSMGEMMLMLEKLSGQEFNVSTTAQSLTDDTVGKTAMKVLRASLVKAAGDDISNGSNDPVTLWTTTQGPKDFFDNSQAWYVTFKYDSEGKVMTTEFNTDKKTEKKVVRCILAF